MRILVTGGAGFIGSHLIDALLEQGHFVVCADNLCLGSEETVYHNYGNSNFLFKELDICDKKRLDTMFAKYCFERVYHLAANSDIQKGGGNPDMDFHNTFLTTLTVIDAMRRHSVKELLFSSSSAIYGDKRDLLKEDTGDLRPISYYGASKLASEAFISAYGAMNDLKVNIIRFPNVVGPRLTHGVIYDFINKLNKNPKKLEILGDGKQEKQYVYVADLVNAMLSMKYSESVTIFNAGVDSSTTVKRIADIVCEEMSLADVEYSFTGGSAGWLGDVPKFKYDLSKIHAFGWTAQYCSDEAVRLAARYSL